MLLTITTTSLMQGATSSWRERSKNWNHFLSLSYSKVFLRQGVMKWAIMNLRVNRKVSSHRGLSTAWEKLLYFSGILKWSKLGEGWKRKNHKHQQWLTNCLWFKMQAQHLWYKGQKLILVEPTTEEIGREIETNRRDNWTDKTSY